MALTGSKIAIALVGLAGFSMSATPLSAAELPRAEVSGVDVYDAHSGDVQNRRWRRDRGVDAGDVIAGVVVIGAIAAIASSASRNRDRDRDYRDRDYRGRDSDYRYRDNRYRDSRGYDSRGMERAVDMCVAQIERGRDRVADIDEANRDAEGWNVAGRLGNGGGFSCRIDNDGRIRDVELGTGYAPSSYNGEDERENYRAATAAANPQLRDEVYARARAGNRVADSAYRYDDDFDDATPAYDPGQDTDGAQPAYPGGPLPGEEGFDEADVYDGRYETAAAR